MRLLFFILTVLPAILSGEYTPATLSEAEQDSILNSESGTTENGTRCTRYRLECGNKESLFRRSELADWYVYDTMTHVRRHLGEPFRLGKVRDAVMSPNGRYVAFAKENNLYLHKLDFGTEVQVTRDDDTDLINGIADWLYEEEFGATALYAWSPDSRQIAFVRLDEHNVPHFAWENYLNSKRDDTKENPQYPRADTLRYPKAGCGNAVATVCVYDVANKGIRIMQVNNEGADCYFPRLRWTDNALLVLRVNRDQTKMEVLSVNPASTVTQLLYKEESRDCFVDYTLFDEWQWLSDGRMIVLSEKDGWRRAFLYSEQGLEQRVLTPDGIDVTALYAVDEAAGLLFYQAAPTPDTRQIYAVSIKANGRETNGGKPVRLTEGEGMHAARFSADCKRMIDCYQSFDTPNRYTVYDVRGTKGLAKGKLLLDNDSLAEAWKANRLPEPVLMRIPNGRGQELEAMLITPSSAPAEHSSNDAAPLVLMHYSGPQSQRVLNRWRKRFEYALVEQGYAVLIVDTRGTDCRGRAWRNETYMNLGIKEAEDLIAAANFIGQREDIDAGRMAIMGWSYGGYETLMTMSTKGHPFKAGVAIAPVTDWRLYDSAYTERYMRRPQVNVSGYRNASLLNHAQDLTGEVLIVHGTADDNVHAQHTFQYTDALVQADKHFEMQLYTDDNHFLKKGNNYRHLHNRILRFLDKNL